MLAEGASVTVSCAEGDTGNVYDGLLDVEIVDTALDKMPPSPTKIMMNVGNPELAFEFRRLPNEGVGLARLEFIIARNVGIHPKALIELEQQTPELKSEIGDRIAGYASPTAFYVSKIVEGVATIAAAFWPKKVIVRLSDFKSNEYSNLLGGGRYEPHEENPMLGFRGASRYIADEFHDCFALECEAMKYVRDEMGLTNVEVMIPFVTVAEAQGAIAKMEAEGLKRGKNGRARDHDVRDSVQRDPRRPFPRALRRLLHRQQRHDAAHAWRGSRLRRPIAATFDERDEAVKSMLAMAITACRKAGKYAGICGQGPSDHPDLAQWLVAQGIESISLNPDSVVETWLLLAGKKAA